MLGLGNTSALNNDDNNQKREDKSLIFFFPDKQKFNLERILSKFKIVFTKVLTKYSPIGESNN